MFHPKLYDTRGAHYDYESETTHFCLSAPNARHVSLVLTAYGKEEVQLPMTQSPNGLWEVVTGRAPPDRTYLYLINDAHGKRMLRTDPYSFSTIYVREANQIQSVVHDENSYQWNDQDWMVRRSVMDPLASPLSIYEIQTKSWLSSTNTPLNYRQMADQLVDYCLKMGFTHVEMYSILDHSSHGERGYQVANYFAPYHRNGQCNDLKYLIDQLHQNGIGVILDWIPTHFRHYHQSHTYSTSLHEYDGTNLYAGPDSAWGTLYFDFTKEETQQILLASAFYYLDRLHFDGIRFDAVSAMVRRRGQDIPSAIEFLRKLNHLIHVYYPGVLSIAEETDGYPNLCRTMNFDLKWNIGWSFDARNFLRTPYHERPKHWNQKVVNTLNSMRWSSDRMITTVSHDDTDSGEHNNDQTLLKYVQHTRNDLEKFSDLRNFFAWLIFAPSRGHLIHMGDEFAQPLSWYQRFRRGLSSPDWSLADSPTLHGGLQLCIRDLNHLYRQYPQFWLRGEIDFSMIYEYGPNLIVAYHRGIHNNRRIAIVHNFSNRSYQAYEIPLPTSDPNVLRINHVVEIFNSDSAQYGGSGVHNNLRQQILIRNGNKFIFRLVMPPLATLVLEEILCS